MFLFKNNNSTHIKNIIDIKDVLILNIKFTETYDNLFSTYYYNKDISISGNEDSFNTNFNFKTKSIKAKLKIKEKVDLKINIESTKIRNLLLTKYPMNFMTFHNGGYTCERKVLSLTNNEKKYWSWINNLDFFI